MSTRRYAPRGLCELVVSGVRAVVVTQVHISDVITQAVLEVDEEGTVAAAAAAVKMAKRSLPRPSLKLAFDRPFVMAILHVPTGAPLFLAQLNEPAPLAG